MNQKEREKRLAYARGQFEIAKLRALQWHAMATTGVATLRKLERGREATEEEKAQGLCMGWRSLTDEEKTKEALDTMQRHIEYMSELNDTINGLMGEE